MPLKIGVLFGETVISSVNFSRRAERIEPGDELCLLLGKSKSQCMALGNTSKPARHSSSDNNKDVIYVVTCR